MCFHPTHGPYPQSWVALPGVCVGGGGGGGAEACSPWRSPISRAYVYIGDIFLRSRWRVKGLVDMNTHTWESTSPPFPALVRQSVVPRRCKQCANLMALITIAGASDAQLVVLGRAEGFVCPRGCVCVCVCWRRLVRPCRAHWTTFRARVCKSYYKKVISF